ncbi:uncharacterized protein BO97DRAFT_408457 [Aspergillus homomorphus CBS 101889]|uniref:CBM-cenC domain-containing protein n=1 Tax=Aspergillus homomorphus (strain CBS 101889) TaxID=1450537 RepID=A0A395HK95_ASPHC|nr:hypothetical protein BO97DRAFT_408457 [Aspergillus homomorphus CBS 101889]RAL08237.1 hypothetical protein BO97DRAFT_408457 [Aspergillus homomorphus CBS 101889]
MRPFSTLSAVVLLAQPFHAAAETKVVTGTTQSCTWTHNALLNPSFDAGVLTPWTVYNGYGTATVVADTSSDGGYVASMVPGTSSYAVLYQSLTDLVVGDTYTLAFDYKIQSSTRPGTCNFYFAIDGIFAANRITRTVSAYVHYDTSETTWQTLSTTYVPTSSSLDMYIEVICSSTVRGIPAQPTIYFDKTQFSNPNKEIEICTNVPYTSTITTFPTPTMTPAQATSSSAGIVSVSPAASSSIIASAISLPQPSASSSSVAVFTSPTLVRPSGQIIPTSHTPLLPSPSDLPTSSSAVPASTFTHSSPVVAPSLTANLPVPVSSSTSHSATPRPSAATSSPNIPEDVVTVTTTVYSTELVIETNCPVLV